MPNRILRDWTDSPTVNDLSWQAEVFFVRLIMKADDYGRFAAHPRLLRSLLFPMRDGIRETDISRWLAECEKAGLIRPYADDEKPFLVIQKFNQRMRLKKPSKFPEPPDEADDLHMTVTRPSRDGHMTARGGGGGACGGAIPLPLAEGVGAVSGFDAFWAAYPPGHRKRLEAKCLQRWRRLKLDPIAPKVMACLEAWKASWEWRKDGGQFIPAPMAWMNSAPWTAPNPPKNPPPPTNGRASGVVSSPDGYTAARTAENRIDATKIIDQMKGAKS
jgi:hypothetical protein